MNERSFIVKPHLLAPLGSAGCQPAVVGSLPTTFPALQQERLEPNVQRAFRQAAEKDRLAAYAPRHVAGLLSSSRIQMPFHSVM